LSFVGGEIKGGEGLPRDAVEIKASIGGGPGRAGIGIRGEETRAFRVVALVADSIFGDYNKRIE